ncbi:hypothetical protein ACHAXS_001532 [Conticribra weissflogii]
MSRDDFNANEEKNRNLSRNGQLNNSMSCDTENNANNDHPSNSRHNPPNDLALDGHDDHEGSGAGGKDYPTDATEKNDTATPRRYRINDGFRIVSDGSTKFNNIKSFDRELFHRLRTQRLNLGSSSRPQPVLRSTPPSLSLDKGTLPLPALNSQAIRMSPRPPDLELTEQIMNHGFQPAMPPNKSIKTTFTTTAQQELRLLGSRYASSSLLPTSKNASNLSDMKGIGASHLFSSSSSFAFDRSVSLLSTDSQWHTADTSAASPDESIPNDDADNDSFSSLHKFDLSNGVNAVGVTKKGDDIDAFISLPLENVGGNYLLQLSHLARDSSNLKPMESEFSSQEDVAATDNSNANNNGECSSSCMSCISSQRSIEPRHVHDSSAHYSHEKRECRIDVEENCQSSDLIRNEKEIDSDQGDYFSSFFKAQLIISITDDETSVNDENGSASSQQEFQGYRSLVRSLFHEEEKIDESCHTTKIGESQSLEPSVTKLISFESINPFFFFFLGSSLAIVVIAYQDYISDEFRRSLTEIPFVVHHFHFNHNFFGRVQTSRVFSLSEHMYAPIYQFVTNFTIFVSKLASGVKEIDITTLALKSMYRIAKIYYDLSQVIDITQQEMISWINQVTDLVESAWISAKEDVLNRYSLTKQRIVIDWRKMWSLILLWQYSLEKHSLPKLNSAASIQYPPIPDWRISSTVPLNMSLITIDDRPQSSHHNLRMVVPFISNQTCQSKHRLWGETDALSSIFNTGFQPTFWMSQKRAMAFFIRHDNFHRHIHSIPSFDVPPDWNIADTLPVHDTQVHTEREFQPILIGIGQSRLALDKLRMENDYLSCINKKLLTAILKHKDENRKTKQEIASTKEDIRKKYMSTYPNDEHAKMEEVDAFAAVSMMDMASDLIGGIISKSRKKNL